MLLIWTDRTQSLCKFKQAILPIVHKKNNSDLAKAFMRWRRQSYLGVVVNLLRNYVVEPQKYKLKRSVIFAWRKYTYLKRNSDYITKDWQLQKDQAVKK